MDPAAALEGNLEAGTGTALGQHWGSTGTALGQHWDNTGRKLGEHSVLSTGTAKLGLRSRTEMESLQVITVLTQPLEIILVCHRYVLSYLG